MNQGGSRQKLLLYRSEVEDVDLSGRSDVTIAESKLTRCNLSDLNARGGELGGGAIASSYVDCRFDRATLVNVSPGWASFVRCSFLEVSIDTFFSHRAEFVDCVFSGSLTKVVFSGMSDDSPGYGGGRKRFHGNDFRGAQLRDVSFRGGIDLDEQQLPEGPDYLFVRNASVALTWLRAQVASWPMLSERKRAEAALWALERGCMSGQRDLFIDKDGLGDVEVAGRLAALIGSLP